LKFLPFWGHTPPADGRIGAHVLSQWFAHPFTHEGALYRTAEHFMMAEKARLFDDHDRLALILDAASPGEAKRHGREVEGFSSDVWDRERVAIVRTGSIAKFGSTLEMRSYLVDTGSAVAQECSVLLLDEPTNHLDIRNQLLVLEQVSSLGCTVIAALHDLQLAARFCTHLVALSAGEVVASGPTSSVLTPTTIAEVFGVVARCDIDPDTGRPSVTIVDPVAAWER
jgi:ribA/ribD-fused uncharacterized protein